jgi:hypothetical protein
MRVKKELLSLVDEAVQKLKDKLGQPLFSDRQAFIDAAVRDFLIEHRKTS